MIFLDSSVLADYLRGYDYVGHFLQSNENVTFHTSSVIMWELFFGALNHPSTTQTIKTVSESLDWVEIVPFTREDAVSAAHIRDELQSNGTPIPVPDVLLAGVVRQSGGTVVTRDRDFERVENLSVELLERQK
jgi:tRNA(fMet)-specific endonuclease VapC